MASSLYSSHFAKAAQAVSAGPASHPALSSMSQHDVSATSSMLTGLPPLTPAPFNTHSMHQGFSLDDMKYHHTTPHHHHSYPHTTPHQDYSSFAAATSMTPSGVFSTYPGLSSAEHSNHHHHTKLNLQTT